MSLNENGYYQFSYRGNSQKDTECLACMLASYLTSGDVLFLSGAVGSGKTFLAGCLIRALGYKGSTPSPTYTIVNRYVVGNSIIFHIDAYRIKDIREFMHLGIEDELDRAILIIEWGNKCDEYFTDYIEVNLSFLEEYSKRTVRLLAMGSRYVDIVNSLEYRVM